MNFDDLCPAGECSYDSGVNNTLRNFHICGNDLPRGYFVSDPNNFLYCFKHREV